MSCLYTINERVEVSKCAGFEDKDLVVVDARRYYYVSGLARTLVLAAGAQLLNENYIGRISAELSDSSVVTSTITALIKREILSVNGQDSQLTRSKLPISMLLRFPLFSAAVTQCFARPFVPLLRHDVMTAGAFLTLCMQIPFLYYSGASAWTAMWHLSRTQIIEVAALNYSCIILHEFGHAAGCLRSGVKPGHIGAGIYLCMPVFFVDVSSLWRVPAKKRVAADAGGIFISCLLAMLSLTTYLSTHNVLFAILTILIDLSLVANANPFIRMDAYWLLSDYLAVDNLMKLNFSTSKQAVRALFGSSEDRASLKALPRLYQTYFIGFFLFSIWITYSLIFRSLPHLQHYFIELYKQGIPEHTSFLHMALECTFRCIPILLLVLVFYRFTSSNLMPICKRILRFMSARLIKEERR